MCGGPESPSSSGKSKEEIYLELAKLAQESFAGRRAVEWKLAFGLWTGIGVFTYFAVENGSRLQGNWWPWVLWSYVGVGIVWTFLYQPLMRRANDVDKAWKHYYMHKAEDRQAEKSEKDPWRPRLSCCERLTEHLSKLLQAWTWAQSLPTVAFLVVSLAIIYHSGTVPHPSVGVESQDKASVTISGRNLEKAVNAVDKVVNHLTEGGATPAVPSDRSSPPSVHDSDPRPAPNGQRTNGTSSP